MKSYEPDSMSRLLKFDMLHNIRDLGGMKTQDGRMIKAGKLIRSGHLAELSEKDMEKLSSLIDTIVDFRTDVERGEKPDLEVSGAEYHHIPVLDSLTEGITREKEADESLFSRLLVKPGEAKAYMCDLYAAFVSNDRAVDQYAAFIRILLDHHNKAVLWHCTAGKDRVGIAAAIVGELLGVDRETIIRDYLTTNNYIDEDIRFLTKFVEMRAGMEGSLANESARYLFGAERDYIESFYNALYKKYGSFDVFVRDGLKMTDEKTSELRKEYLIESDSETVGITGA